jgi:hypothetical protein
MGSQPQASPAALGSLLFSDLHDSPLFRSKVNELDGSLERLKDRAAKLTKASKKYSTTLDSTSLGTSSFADRQEQEGLLAGAAGASHAFRPPVCLDSHAMSPVGQVFNAFEPGRTNRSLSAG